MAILVELLADKRVEILHATNEKHSSTKSSEKLTTHAQDPPFPNLSSCRYHAPCYQLHVSVELVPVDPLNLVDP